MINSTSNKQPDLSVSIADTKSFKMIVNDVGFYTTKHITLVVVQTITDRLDPLDCRILKNAGGYFFPK